MHKAQHESPQHPNIAMSSSSTAASSQAQATKPTRRRTPKTCGECRRLKLKCDRVFPCQSCIKRGCEGICPEGSLISGRGSRYILANTEQLHEKIVRMAERIRDLEDALKIISEEHARCLNLDLPPSGPTHPLLKEDLLLIKNQLELYGPDRSQFATRPDVMYASDGSDGEHSRLGSEQPLSPSQLEAFILGSTTHLIDPQVQQYSGSDMVPNAPYTSSQWPADLDGSNPYHTEAPVANDNSASPGAYMSTVSTVPTANYQLRSYSSSRSVPATRNEMGVSAAHALDGTRYLPTDSLPQNEAELMDQMRRIWNMNGSSII
ncbi:hypothetical protein ACEPAF_9666 [Sanghuangporus sanghuang]